VEVRLADGRMATYEVLGSGEPLLSFVSGPGMPARFMRPNVRLFAERFTFYLIDPHGSGGSTPPREDDPYGHEGHARFYEEVRRVLSLGPAIVHGGSFGDTVALTYAALFPETTTRRIAVSAIRRRGGARRGGRRRGRLRVGGCTGAARRCVLVTRRRARCGRTGRRTLAAIEPSDVAEMLTTVWLLYTAYPDRPDVREALDEAR
jgi:pimeloyl-ACP methyl ester carboxylesterase